MAIPITNLPSLEHKSLGSVNSRLIMLEKAQACLFNIENTLNILESSLVADTYLNILEIGAINDRGLSEYSTPKEFCIRPTILLALINYVRCISKPGAVTWQVDNFSDNFNFLLNNISAKIDDTSTTNNKGNIEDRDAVETIETPAFTPKNISFSIESFRKFELFTEGYAILCMNHNLFFGGLSLLQNIVQEQVLNNIPSSAVVEGSLLRYLVESYLDKAIQECYNSLSLGNNQIQSTQGKF